MRILLALAMALAPLYCSAAQETVHLKKNDGKIVITIGDQPFGMFHYEGFKKPFMIDLRAPNGTVITRSLEADAIKDHPHHKGLWFSVDEIDEHKHWVETQVIDTKSVEILKADGNPASFRMENLWLDNDGKPLLKETTTVRIYGDRVISYDAILAPAGDEPVTIGDSKEGFFAIRLRDELTEGKGTGRIVNATGAKGEKEAWGKTSPWVDYSGTVDGKEAGVALFDHPENFRPSRYHVRGYGLFGVNPFGESAYTNRKDAAKPLRLQAGEQLRLRYAAYIHDGDTGSADVAGRFQEYASSNAE